VTGIGDDRIWFYLENREQIDEWARLMPEAADAVLSVFLELREQLEGLAAGLDGKPGLLPFLDGSWPAYALVEMSWPPVLPGQRPLVAVTLETRRGAGLLSGPSVPNMFVGIRVERDLARGPELHRALLTATRDPTFYGNRPTPWWPLWRNVPPPSQRWWEDRQAFETALIGALVKAWSDLGPIVDATLRSFGAASED
jgi:hypothetical protein